MKQVPVIGSPTLPSLTTPRRIQLTPQIPLYLLSRAKLPLVHLALVIRAGAADGLLPAAACTTAGLLDEGAGGRNALALSAAVEQIGAKLTIQCGWSWTSVAISTLSRHLDEAAKLLVDVVTRPALQPVEFTRVREELRGRSLARRAEPGRVAELVLRQAVFGAHPYGRPLLPLPRDLDALEHRDVLRFYRRHYRPGQVFAVVVGDIGPAKGRAILLTRLAAWRPQPIRRAPSATTASPPATAPRLIIVDRPGASQSVLRVGLIGPPRKDPNHAALLLVNTALGGSFTSRINQNLRETRGLTYGAHSRVWSSRDHGLFTVGAAVEAAATVIAAEQILTEMRGVIDRPPRGPELARARSLVVEQLPDRVETLAGLASTITELVALDLPVNSLGTLIEKVAQLDTATLRQTAARVVQPNRATLVVVGDQRTLAAPLVARFGEALLLDPDGRPAR